MSRTLNDGRHLAEISVLGQKSKNNFISKI